MKKPRSGDYAKTSREQKTLKGFLPRGRSCRHESVQATPVTLNVLRLAPILHSAGRRTSHKQTFGVNE
jgi:hypothetical protein